MKVDETGEVPGSRASTPEQPRGEASPSSIGAQSLQVPKPIPCFSFDNSIGQPPSPSSPMERMVMTDSLLVGDRSRNNEANFYEMCRRDSHYRVSVVDLAGPMRDWDALYILLILLIMFTCMGSVCSLFVPCTFSVVKPMVTTVKMHSLFDSKPCSSFSSKNEELHDLCYGSSGVFGWWVLVVQVASCLGLGLAIIALILQLVDLSLKPRNKPMHDATMYIMAAAVSCLLVAGHISHNLAVWAEYTHTPPDKSTVLLESMNSGLLLLGAVLGGWSCVVTHITQHAPGPLSRNTRFLHTLQKDVAAEPFVVIQSQDIDIQEPVLDEHDRKASVVSTEV